jgi:putative MFS transporter
MIMRFIQGIGMGPETPIAAVYISEIAPAERRGRFTLLYQLVFGIGLIAAGILGRILVPIFGWQSIFWIGAIPALVVAPLIYQLPESARWLISTGRIEKARSVVSKIEIDIVKSGKTLPPASERIDVITIRTTYPVGSAWRELFSDFYKRRTILIWTLWIAVGFISWPLTTWLPTIYRTVYHISIEQSLTFGMVNNITIFCSLVLCAFLIDPVGRRKYFAAAFTVAACALLALAPGDRSIEKLFLFSSVCLFGISSLNIGVHVYTAELYPTRLRAVGLGICNAWSRVAGLLAPWVIGLGVQAGGLGTVFLVLGCIAACAAVLTAFFGVETRKRILEEISP